MPGCPWTALEAWHAYRRIAVKELDTVGQQDNPVKKHKCVESIKVAYRKSCIWCIWHCEKRAFKLGLYKHCQFFNHGTTEISIPFIQKSYPHTIHLKQHHQKDTVHRRQLCCPCFFGWNVVHMFRCPVSTLYFRLGLLAFRTTPSRNYGMLINVTLPFRLGLNIWSAGVRIYGQ